MRRIPLLLLCAIMLADASVCTAQLLHKKKPTDKSTDSTNTVEPDKILYDRATDDVKRGKYETGRLGLQTLINTYPDSEYLAKAKLAIATRITKRAAVQTYQAIAGYKDFIVFFPFLPESGVRTDAGSDVPLQRDAEGGCATIRTRMRRKQNSRHS